LDHLAGPAAGGPRPLHLSYDIDAVDPSVAPSTGTTVPGGLNYREAHYVAEACAETGLLGSMDVVEINPDLAPGAGGMATVAAASQFIASALGRTILGKH
jgi:arginase